jgi:hypothetical protein
MIGYFESVTPAVVNFNFAIEVHYPNCRIFKLLIVEPFH